MAGWGIPGPNVRTKPHYFKPGTRGDPQMRSLCGQWVYRVDAVYEQRRMTAGDCSRCRMLLTGTAAKQLDEESTNG